MNQQLLKQLGLMTENYNFLIEHLIMCQVLNENFGKMLDAHLSRNFQLKGEVKLTKYGWE